MHSSNLFVPICVPLILLLVFIVAVAGMKSRLKFAKRLFGIYKDEKRIEQWRKGKNKHRLLSLTALASILGIIFLTLLILFGALSMSNVTLIIFVVLILLCFISGFIILADLEKLTK